MLPSDPRTWTDFSDPASHGFQKIDCDTVLEQALKLGAIVLGVAFVVILLPVRGSRAPWLSTNVMTIVVPGLAVGALVLLALRALTNNFFLIDRARHAVYFHFQFLLIRRVRLLLDHQDILAMAVQTQRRRQRYSSWWEYRAVLIDTRGRTVPMDNWTRDGLWASNNLATEIAKELSCPVYESPEDSRLVVRRGADGLSVIFEPYSRFPWI